ncbi:PspC domain-containing protein [Flammeovirgaceae bacterium SG7u.111]|nr:PspC domain-containing protein [Flammeovirgaceae bacterium SG7u.132]WPO34646.1 PspC domain-containing protein [Flammeovirgaceae bacterium SG7u.111]
MKLVKSTYDKMVFGVCGGLAQSFNMDATLLRILFAIATVLGIGSPIIIYVILALVMPKDHYI